MDRKIDIFITFSVLFTINHIPSEFLGYLINKSEILKTICLKSITLINF